MTSNTIPPAENPRPTMGRSGRQKSDRPRIAVVFGGVSSEHQISCLTAGSVLAVIDRQRYDVMAIGITRTGRWVWVPEERHDQLQITAGVLPVVPESLPDVSWRRTADGAELVVTDASAGSGPIAIDTAFSLLHGPFGEDGTVQGLFEMMGVRYVGAGVLASAVGMDKIFMKQVLVSAGLPVGPFVPVQPAAWAREREGCLAAVNQLTYPLYVKPARGGSSLGITRVVDSGQLVAAIEQAQQFDPKVIVEAGFVGARELECGVLGGLAGDRAQASQVAEIRVHTESGFYDFEAKYLPEEQVDLDVPAAVEQGIADQIRQLAVRTFEAIDGEGLARVDVFVTADQQVFVNEINTMPGFTSHSMFPRMWAASGLAYPELVDRLLQLAIQRPVGLR